MSTELTVIGPLQEALALATEAGDIDRLRDIAATATALQKGAKARGMGLEAENQAAEVVLRAERAIGRALPDPRAVMSERAALRATAGNQFTETTEREGLADGKPLLPTAAELGFDIKTAWRFRALAAMDDAEFEARFATVKATGARLAKVDFYRLVKAAPEKKPEAEQAMHGDGYSPIALAFAKAATALIENISQLPHDELLAVAGDITRLVTAYNAERARR